MRSLRIIGAALLLIAGTISAVANPMHEPGNTGVGAEASSQQIAEHLRTSVECTLRVRESVTVISCNVYFYLVNRRAPLVIPENVVRVPMLSLATGPRGVLDEFVTHRNYTHFQVRVLEREGETQGKPEIVRSARGMYLGAGALQPGMPLIVQVGGQMGYFISHQEGPFWQSLFKRKETRLGLLTDVPLDGLFLRVLGPKRYQPTIRVDIPGEHLVEPNPNNSSEVSQVFRSSTTTPPHRLIRITVSNLPRVNPYWKWLVLVLAFLIFGVVSMVWVRFARKEAAEVAAPPKQRVPSEFPGTRALIWVNILWFVIYVVGFGGAILGYVESRAVGFGGSLSNHVLAGEYWRVLTAGLVHISMIHLLNNLWAIRFWGRRYEADVGPWALLLTYVLGGAAGVVATLFHSPPTVVFFGASAGVIAIWGGSIGIQLRSLGGDRRIALITVLAQVLLVPIYLLIQFLSTSSLAVGSHLAGFMTGLFVGIVLAGDSTPPRVFYSLRRILVAVIGLVGVLLVIGLTPRASATLFASLHRMEPELANLVLELDDMENKHQLGILSDEEARSFLKERAQPLLTRANSQIEKLVQYEKYHAGTRRTPYNEDWARTHMLSVQAVNLVQELVTSTGALPTRTTSSTVPVVLSLYRILQHQTQTRW